MAKQTEKKELVKKEGTRPDFFSPLGSVDQYFDRIFRHPLAMMMHPAGVFRDLPGMEGLMTPSVDIFEEGGDMVVRADIPGIGKDDLDVSITENTLTISGERKQEEKKEKKDYHRVECSYGSFRRSFRLPENVKGEKAKAQFRDGVLEVRIPKSKETKAKKISIS